MTAEHPIAFLIESRHVRKTGQTRRVQGAFEFRHVARSTITSAEKDALYMLYARNRLNA